MRAALLVVFVLLSGGLMMFVEFMAFRSTHALQRPTVLRPATESRPAVTLHPVFRPASPRQRRLLGIYIALLGSESH